MIIELRTYETLQLVPARNNRRAGGEYFGYAGRQMYKT